MAAALPPFRVDLPLVQGDTLRLRAVYLQGETEEDADPVNLTGWTGVWAVERTEGLVVENFSTVATLGSDGMIDARFDDTSAWKSSGVTTHQLRLVNPDGDKKTIAFGRVPVTNAPVVGG